MTKELLTKYFSGRCSAEEAAEVSAYLKGDDLSLLDEYMNEVNESTVEEYPLSSEESEMLLQAIHHEINTEEMLRLIQHHPEPEEKRSLPRLYNQDEAKTIQMKRNVRTMIVSFQVAASIALLCTLTLGAYWIFRQQTAGNKSEKVASIWTTINNGSANVRQVKMPDGTQIWLNVHSSVAFKKSDYNISQREVKMTGEAWFDVSHNPEKPFIVRSGKVSTTVLGTAFNVEAYKNEQDIRVVLVRGKVKVQAGNQQQVLKPGQLMNFNKQDQEMAVKEVETADVNSWINGKLVFNDVPLEDAFERVERLYQVRIKVPENLSLKGKKLTGVFERKSADDLLYKMLFVFGFDYDRKGGEYTITHN